MDKIKTSFEFSTLSGISAFDIVSFKENIGFLFQNHHFQISIEDTKGYLLSIFKVSVQLMI